MSRPLVVSVPDDRLLAALREVPGVDALKWDLITPPPRPEFDIVVPPYLESPENLAALDGVSVRLVQYQSIGYDGVREHLPEGMTFANASTVHETSTAELTLTLILAMQRQIPSVVRHGDRGVWSSYFAESLADRRVLLVGYGNVSKAIEARLAPFEVNLTRVASSDRQDENLAGESVRVHAISRLPELLADAEIVVLAVPLTSDTQRLIDAAALAMLPDGALVVNVARGPVVDTDALVDALNSGRIRAALDVTDPEPLPPEHEIWRAPNVLITPHVGGASSAMFPRMVGLLRRQIEHLRAGEEPENVISIRR